MYFVYLLQCSITAKWYIGYTSDLQLRLKQHNERKSIFTSKYGPWKLIYYEAYLEQRDAIGREIFLKSGSGYRYLKKQMKHYIERAQPREHTQKA